MHVLPFGASATLSRSGSNGSESSVASFLVIQALFVGMLGASIVAVVLITNAPSRARRFKRNTLFSHLAHAELLGVFCILLLKTRAL